MPVIVDLNLSAAYGSALQIAQTARTQAAGWRTRVTSGPQQADRLYNYARSTKRMVVDLTGIIAVPGLLEYARDQQADPSYDLPAELTALQAAIAAVRDWLYTSIPRAAGPTPYVLLLEVEEDPPYDETPRTFTSAQLAPLVPLLDGVIAAVTIT